MFVQFGGVSLLDGLSFRFERMVFMQGFAGQMPVVRKSFREGTRIHRIKQESVEHKNGQTLPFIEIVPAGWLGSLIVEAELDIVAGAAPSWKADGALALAKKFTLRINGQSFVPIQVSGYQQRLLEPTFRFGGHIERGLLSSTPDAQYYQDALVANTTNRVRLVWHLHAAQNLGVNMDTGLLPLLARQLSCFLEIETAAIADVLNDCTAITGKWKTTAQVFNQPVGTTATDASSGQQYRIEYDDPVLTGVRTFSRTTNITGNGTDVEVKLPVEGTIVDAIHVLRFGGARQDWFSKASLVLGGSNVQDNYDRSTLKFLNAKQYGEVPTGVIYMPIADSLGINQLRDGRDALDTRFIADTRFIISIDTQGNAFPANNNFVDSIYRVVVPYSFEA